MARFWMVIRGLMGAGRERGSRSAYLLWTTLTLHELYYEKSEVWIETEKMYEVLYELTV